MSNPQATIGLHFGREWRIRRPYVYRYLDSRYVDDFFRDGSLRISSFKSFANHDDEQRNDATEGQGMIWNTTSEGAGQTMVAVMSQGNNAYVLCGSTSHDPSLADAFSADSGFRINDTTAFADAVGHRISGFTGGIEGACLYLARKNVQRDVGLVNLDNLKTDSSGQSLDLGKMMGFFGDLAGDDLYFMKPNRYSHQNEYRLLWFAHDEANVYADIKCPEARQFCTRFEDLWSDVQSS
jgi:hypothetical protein